MNKDINKYLLHYVNCCSRRHWKTLKLNQLKTQWKLILLFHWHASFCMTAIANCESNPCNNDATCEETSDGYSCSCQSGFTGDNCEIEEDECVSSPCAQGATCLDKVWSMPGFIYHGLSSSITHQLSFTLNLFKFFLKVDDSFSYIWTAE